MIISINISQKKRKDVKEKRKNKIYKRIRITHWYFVDGIQTVKHNQTIWGSNDNWQP